MRGSRRRSWGCLPARRRRVSATQIATMGSITRRIDSWIRRDSSSPGYCRATSTNIGPTSGTSAGRRSRTARRAGRRRCRGCCRRCRRRARRPAPPARHGCRARDRGRGQYSAIDGGTGSVDAGRPQERAVVLDRAFERLPGQVEPVELGVALLEPGQDAQGLGVVVESRRSGFISALQRLLAGMAERRVAEIVRQRHRLGEVLVEPQRAGRWCGRSAPPRGCGSAACGSGRPRDRRRPASCASAGGTPSNG